MKILIDIGHPGHVHYFKNLITDLEAKNHKIVVTARERGIIFSLLERLDIKYINRGMGGSSRLSKLLYIFFADFILLKISLREKIDFFVSFSSPYAAHTSMLLRKPHVALNDTEHTDAIHKVFTYPFSNAVLTPLCYKNNLKSKQIKFNSVMEGLYLHDAYFKPNINVLDALGVDRDDQFIIIRLVSWEAHHDYGHSGLELQTVLNIIDLLGKQFKFFISSESKLPEQLQKYQIKISPDMMHDVLYYASLFIGESATMASESAFLGTSAVYVNSLPLMGYLDQAQRAGVLKHFNSSNGVSEYVSDFVQNSKFEDIAQNNSLIMKKNFINPTEFLSWFICSYPGSMISNKIDSEIIFKENSNDYG